jgi:hypothetical protein
MIEKLLTSDLIATLLGLSAYCFVYTLLLWFMMRIQKLNYTVPALFLSSVIATAIGQIPIVGSYASFVVLLVCLRIFTREDVFPDLVFTVAVAGALMFAVNLWLLGALMGDLREFTGGASATALAEETEEVIPTTVIELVEQPSGPLSLANPNAGRTAATPRELMLKGLTISDREQFVLVGLRDKFEPLKAGERALFNDEGDMVEVLCESVQSNCVLLQVRRDKKKERIELRFRAPDPLPISQESTEPRSGETVEDP